MHCWNGFKYDTYKDGFPENPLRAVCLITDEMTRKAQKVQHGLLVGISPADLLGENCAPFSRNALMADSVGPLAMENAPHDTVYATFMLAP